MGFELKPKSPLMGSAPEKCPPTVYGRGRVRFLERISVHNYLRSERSLVLARVIDANACSRQHVRERPGGDAGYTRDDPILSCRQFFPHDDSVCRRHDLQVPRCKVSQECIEDTDGHYPRAGVY